MLGAVKPHLLRARKPRGGDQLEPDEFVVARQVSECRLIGARDERVAVAQLKLE